jgi:hypothetical protein
LKKINFTKKLIFYKRSETGCNEVTFGDCNVDVGGVLGTLNNISMGKKGILLMDVLLIIYAFVYNLL